MKDQKTRIYVYSDWEKEQAPTLMGELLANHVRGNLSWSFSYNPEWMKSKEQLVLDPDLAWFEGKQYANRPVNFGIFLDSMPDRWGRVLMQRKAALDKENPNLKLNELDYLLGVHDETRMGGLRFKTEKEGPFLADNDQFTVPPISDLRELQVASEKVEDDSIEDIGPWLKLILAPGSSLGGARPKASVRDEKGELWIAKFPAKSDTIDKGAWEYLTWELAKKAGIEVPDAQLMNLGGSYRTFLSKRFDRVYGKRIHCASGMTLLGRYEAQENVEMASYLDLAEFIQTNSVEPRHGLHQLWRRILFHVLVSNTDDHLRNHSFILTGNGWKLSPAYDMNPSIDKNGLSLTIDLTSNALNVDLVRSVASYFDINEKQMNSIQKEVQEVLRNWKESARSIGISRREIELMSPAFGLL